MANVWYEKDDRKWRVCWRDEPTPEAPQRRKGSKSVATIEARDELVVKVRRELDVHGFYRHEAPPEQRVANLLHAADAYLRFRHARGASPGTIKTYGGAWRRFAKDIRAVKGIAEGEKIPVTVLGVELFTLLLARWQAEGLGEATRYALCTNLLSVWLWSADEAEWPGVPVPPRDTKKILPPCPPKGRAPDAPTPAECDAVARRAAAATGELRDLVAMLRLTGLRVGQILAIKIEDIDVPTGTLRVMTGKGRREKADRRVVPLHPTLIPLLRLRLARPPSSLLFPPRVRRGVAPAHARSKPSDTLRGLWIAATEAGECRRHVWHPVGRKSARPDHCFRAAFLAELRARGVAEDLRAELVGHACLSTEGRAYSAPTLDDLRAAVAKLPPIDWAGPDAPGNVIQLRA